jgi:hypothetical protein
MSSPLEPDFGPEDEEQICCELTDGEDDVITAPCSFPEADPAKGH